MQWSDLIKFFVLNCRDFYVIRLRLAAMSFTPVEIAFELCKYIPELEITFNPNPMLQKIGKVPGFVELTLFRESGPMVFPK